MAGAEHAVARECEVARSEYLTKRAVHLAVADEDEDIVSLQAIRATTACL